MIVLVALILGVVAVFGLGTSRVALGDLAQLETQDAAQRAAEAAVGRAADLIVAGASTDAEIDAAAQQEATLVGTANVARGQVTSVQVTRSSSTADLVDVQVVLSVQYGGLPGPLALSATGAAGVPRSGP